MKISKYLLFTIIICLVVWLSLFLDRYLLLQNSDLIIKLNSKLLYIPHIIIIFLAFKIYNKSNPENRSILFWFVITNIGLLLNDISWYFLSYFNFNLTHISMELFLINLIPFFIWIISITIFSAKILNRYALNIRHRINTLITFIILNIAVIALFLSAIHYATEVLSLSTIAQISTFIAQVIVFDFVILCLIYTESRGLAYFLSGIIILISGDFFIVYSIISQTTHLYSYGTLLWLLGLLFNLFGVLIIQHDKDYNISTWVRPDNTIKSKLVFWCFNIATISFLLFFLIAYIFSIINTAQFLGLPMFIMIYSIIIITLSIYLGKHFETPFKQIVNNIQTRMLVGNKHDVYTDFSISEFVFLQNFIIDAFICKEKQDKERLKIESERAEARVALKEEQLKLEYETNQSKLIQLENKARFIKIVDQLVHDIRSPIASLQMFTSGCADLPEDDRIILREIATSISDIANSVLSRYNKDNEINNEEQQTEVLISVAMLQILTDKKFQYKDLSVKFEYNFAPNSYLTFIKISASSFKRMISNLINNAVDAINNNSGIVMIKIKSTQNQVTIIIEDNGFGIPQDIIDKIMQNKQVTQGKKNGHGIGFTQVHKTLELSNGKLNINSTINQGTKISLTFPRIDAPNWIAEEIRFASQDIVIVLDDDPSIHKAWDLRFKAIVIEVSNLQIKHFTQGHDAINFINNLSSEQKQRIFLLTDYELLKQDLNGLNIIEQLKIERSILVTSHYAKVEIQNCSMQLNTKILPKQLASEIPIIIE